MTAARKCKTGYTLAHIQARCDECGDCLLWRGSCNGAGHPKIEDEPARRTVWKLAKGAIPLGALVTVTCGQTKCLTPAHLALTSKAAVARLTNARPDVKLRRAAACARSARERLGKITMPLARHIRTSPLSGKEMAKELDVSESLISLVRRNKSWVEHAANPWQGLGA